MSKVLQRKLLKISDNTGTPLSILQFNTLADELSDAFPEANPDILKWNFRSELLLEEIIQRDSDVICLEEVDHFDDFFFPHLSKLGYDGKFLMKTMENNKPRDGCCIFFKNSKLKLEILKEVHFNYTKDAKGAQVGIICKFLFEKKSFLCAMTHLKAKEGHEELRKNQIKHFISEIKKMNENKLPIIICGDLNDIPDSLCYKELELNEFSSSYKLYGDDIEPYTTFKKRKEIVKRCIDYIWYTSDTLKVEQLLEIPNSDDLKDYLPCDIFPSDHLSIQTIFNFIEK
eukprot:gene2907-4750_t